MAHQTWDMTINNYSDTDIDLLKTWSKPEHSMVSTMVVSKEVGESGTPHLQGRITFKRTYRLKALKILHNKVHWETTKCKQDSLYCMKRDSDIIINVNNKRQGARTDLEQVSKRLKEGATVRDIANEYPETYMKFHAGIKSLALELNQQYETPKYQLSNFPWEPIEDWTKSHILWGPAGVGKTQFALAHFQHPILIRHKDQLKEFNPAFHDGIVFDDMNFHHWPRETQIHILDIENKSAIDVKHGIAVIPAGTKRVFTTNVYNGDIVMIHDSAIARRVSVREVAKR